mmetsp:Transcript_67086/g.143543  ORF Transcript_67086/g.143543 Transcript_67086/m.143543 type:complete len:377 (-) Transcript_67086:196-1326(-)
MDRWADLFVDGDLEGATDRGADLLFVDGDLTALFAAAEAPHSVATPATRHVVRLETVLADRMQAHGRQQGHHLLPREVARIGMQIAQGVCPTKQPEAPRPQQRGDAPKCLRQRGHGIKDVDSAHSIVGAFAAAWTTSCKEVSQSEAEAGAGSSRKGRVGRPQGRPCSSGCQGSTLRVRQQVGMDAEGTQIGRRGPAQQHGSANHQCRQRCVECFHGALSWQRPCNLECQAAGAASGYETMQWSRSQSALCWRAVAGKTTNRCAKPLQNEGMGPCTTTDTLRLMAPLSCQLDKDTLRGVLEHGPQSELPARLFLGRCQRRRAAQRRRHCRKGGGVHIGEPTLEERLQGLNILGDALGHGSLLGLHPSVRQAGPVTLA